VGELEALKTVAWLRLLADDIQDRVDQFSPWNKNGRFFF
jgi:hypothetical protein